MTKEELDKQHEDECSHWRLLQSLVICTEKAVDDSLYSLGISIIAIILSAISIGLHFV